MIRSKKASYSLLWLTLIVSGCGWQTGEIRENSPLAGEILTTEYPLYYMEKCNNKHSCGSTKIVREIDRSLVCNKLNISVAHIYDKSYLVEYPTDFEVIEVIDIVCHGIECTFNPDYALALLEDSKGLRSTHLLSGLWACRIYVQRSDPRITRRCIRQFTS